MKYVTLYLSTLVIMATLDFLWIGVIANEFYTSRIDNLEFSIVPAVMFYIMYVTGVLIFVSGKADATWKTTLQYGALLGFFAYATYDLTNLATLKGWSPVLAVVDVAWGSFVTAVAATAGLRITQYFQLK